MRRHRTRSVLVVFTCSASVDLVGQSVEEVRRGTGRRADMGTTGAVGTASGILTSVSGQLDLEPLPGPRRPDVFKVEPPDGDPQRFAESADGAAAVPVGS
jgi:hypothetical protein